jgi:RNA polymerase sigma-70 factor (ECF subfamily)
MTNDDPQYDTRSSLLRHLADPGNHEAWTEFLNRYRPMILRWCRNVQLSHDESQDMLGTVLLKLAHEMATFQLDRSRGRFRSWLKTVVHREIQDYWRYQSRRPADGRALQASFGRLERVIDPASLESLSDDLSDSIDNGLREVEGIVESVRRRVEAVSWSAFWRTAIDGVSAREAAAELNLTLAAVSQAKYRVSKLLQQAAADYEARLPDQVDRSPSM